MVLKNQRLSSVLFDRILGNTHIERWSSEAYVILNKNSVMKHCNARRCEIRSAVGTKTRSCKNYIISLPFSRLSARINKRGILFVKRTGLPLPVGGIIIAIENLDFIKALQVYSAVAPARPSP